MVLVSICRLMFLGGHSGKGDFEFMLYTKYMYVGYVCK